MGALLLGPEAVHDGVVLFTPEVLDTETVTVSINEFRLRFDVRDRSGSSHAIDYTFQGGNLGQLEVLANVK